LLCSKPVEGVPWDDLPVPRVPVLLREADRLVTHGVGAALADEDGLLQLHELCPELEGLVGGKYVVGGLGLLELQLEVLDVAEESGAQLLQLILLQVLGLDLPIPDVVKSKFVQVSADQATGHRRCVDVSPGNTPGVVALVALTLVLHLTLLATSGLGPWHPWHQKCCYNAKVCFYN
jgi:hypothetical protein